ncbi:PREDICTED: fibrous sheath-interacting protein 1-like [Branchiostoma belcheri]|uniref:Fibrous sheath-interacting protein 1 n=1 Tax=Branchiostoma belcheri TaxID=7741 RepID=A0A6P4ZRH5_BRABE|nr:PREDICTED: fibrous sheath-interacting protein 1-like [Branchiostoma belcheri]
MDITRGSLENITKPARSGRSRPDSRVSLSSASSRRSYTGTSLGSLEILTPEPPLLQYEEEDIELEEYLSSGDSASESGEESSRYGLSSELSDVPQYDRSGALSLGRHMEEAYKAGVEAAQKSIAASQLIPIGRGNGAADDDDDDVSLNESGTDSPLPITDGQKEGEGKGEDNEETIEDPKLRAAIKKMEKLDRILAKKVLREKEVKRQRMDLFKRLKDEMGDIKPEGRDEQKEVSHNTMKFLALAPPDSHNQGGQSSRTASQQSSVTGAAGGKEDQRRRRRAKKKTSSKEEGSTDKEKPDFIKRNIQLASDANSLIAMTDDEKKRLEELLENIDTEEDNQAGDTPVNPFQLSLVPGTGFTPEEDDIKALRDIDSKLQVLLPPHDYESICSSPRNYNIQNDELFQMTDLRSSLDVMQLGERVLRDTRQVRDQQHRLHDIERELEELQTQVEQEMESPSLSEFQLQALLDQCAQVSSRATSETQSLQESLSPRSQASSRSSRITMATVDTPRLPEDTLRKLLEEASKSVRVRRDSEETEQQGQPSYMEMAEGALGRRLAVLDVNGEVDRPAEDVSSQPEGDGSSYLARAQALLAARKQDVLVESVSEDTIQELLQNPRATSQSSSRPPSSCSSPRTPRGSAESAASPRRPAAAPQEGPPQMRLSLEQGGRGGTREAGLMETEPGQD